MAKLRAYLPWLLTAIAGFLAVYYGAQPPSVVTHTVTDTVRVKEIVIREGQARLVYVKEKTPHTTIVTSAADAADSAALAHAMHLNDSLFHASQEGRGVWIIDTTYVVFVDDSIPVPVTIHMEIDRDSGQYSMVISTGDLIYTREGCADQSNIWWQIAAAIAAAAASLLATLKK